MKHNPLVLIDTEVRLEKVKTDKRKRRTLHPVCLFWNQCIISIFQGFEYDGATVPFFLWWWVNPWHWLVKLASLVHDYLYRYNLLTRRECDLIFYHIMIAIAKLRYPKYKDGGMVGFYHRARLTRRVTQARIMYRAVRVFGGVHSGREW